MDKKHLENIYWLLLKSGAGKSPTEMVFLEDDMFDAYIKWDKEGMDILDIALNLQDEWIKRNPTSTLEDLDPPYIPSVKQLSGLEENPVEERRQKAIDYRFEREKQRNNIDPS